MIYIFAVKDTNDNYTNYSLTFSMRCCSEHLMAAQKDGCPYVTDEVIEYKG